jgi:predicted ATPase
MQRLAFDIVEKYDKKERTFEKIYSFLRATKISGKPDIAIAPIRTKPRRTYDEINDEYKPEGDHIPIILSRVLDEDNRQKQILLDALKSYGVKSGLFKNVKVKRLGKRPSDPFQLFVTISGGREANIVDVGYGVNQVLPVLVESILAPSDRRITMQQPEVHLHPRAQSALGSFMVDLVQKHKKQFVLETHSDYILDRVRQEVAAGHIDKDKVSILFFEKPGFETTVHVLKLDKQGNVLNAPPSYREFFLKEQLNLLMA